MDAEALRTFLAIHRDGGFSAAARRLRRTQPAISRRIALLEAELGVPLFERSAGGPRLSLAGRTLVPRAERVLAAIEDAEAAIRALSTEIAGPIALAAVGTLAGPNLTPILKRFMRRHRGVDLTLRTATSAEVSDLVRRGEATIGIRYDRDRSQELTYARLGVEGMFIAAAADHPLAGKSIKSLVALRGQRWVAFPELPGRRETAASYVFAVFRAGGLGDVDWTPVDSLTAQKRLVEAGLGLALLPRSAAAEELAAGTLAPIRLRKLGAGLEVTAVTRKGGFLSTAAQRLLSDLRAAFIDRRNQG